MERQNMHTKIKYINCWALTVGCKTNISLHECACSYFSTIFLHNYKLLRSTHHTEKKIVHFTPQCYNKSISKYSYSSRVALCSTIEGLFKDDILDFYKHLNHPKS